MLRRCALLMVAALLLTPVKTEAFSVQPAIQELSVRAGESIQRQVTVTNPDLEPVELFFTVQKFVAGGGGAPLFLPPSDTAGLPEWIRVSTPRVMLRGGESRTIQVDIRPPATAESRGHSVALFAAEVAPPGGNVQVAKRIATLWFVTVQGRSGEPALPAWEVSMSEPRIRHSGWKTEVSTIWNVRNTGMTHGIAVLPTEIRGLTRTLSATSTVLRLLPGESREGLVSASTIWPINRIVLKIEDPSGRPLERQVWVIGRSAWAVIALAVGSCLVMARRWSKRRRRGILGA